MQFITFQSQTLSSSRFQREFDRVNLHRLTVGLTASYGKVNWLDTALASPLASEVPAPALATTPTAPCAAAGVIWR